MAGVDNIALQVSQLTEVEELDAVTAAVNSRLAVLREVGSLAQVNQGAFPVITPVLEQNDALAADYGMGGQSDKKTT